MLPRDLAILEHEVGLRAPADDVLVILHREQELIAEVLALDDADPRRGAAFAGTKGRIVPVERDDDATDLDLVARHHEAPLAGIERDVADRAVGPDRDERHLADPGVLVIDARDVDANFTRDGATDRERTWAQLDATRLAEGPSGRDDQMHRWLVSHDPTSSCR
jgi:hypothetical protein